MPVLIMKLTLRYDISIEENASIYFDRAKQAKKKLLGLHEAMQKTDARLAKLEKERENVQEETAMRIASSEAALKKEWYEKFRWFMTSSGHLAIGGRDTHTNEQLIKKHAGSKDIVFHTDMAGSPFFILKLDDGESATPQEIAEVAQATVCYSRAWGKGLGSSDVFWVTPDQVTKEANAGESLGTGAFVIRGKTTYVSDVEMVMAIGIVDMKIIGGPPSAVRHHSQAYVLVAQGDEKPGKVAKLVRKFLGGGDLDDIIRAMPTGGLRVKETRVHKGKKTKTDPAETDDE